MMDFVLYLVKASINLGLIYLLYHLLLRKLTFYGINRMILLSGLMAALLLPLITIHFHYNPSQLYNSPGKELGIRSAAVNQIFTGAFASEKMGDRSQVNPIIFVWTVGFLFFFLRLLKSFSKLIKAIKESTSVCLDDIIILVNSKIRDPFSFFNFCVIPERMIATPAVHAIVKHERIHGEQLHSLDILLIEFVSLFLWFNPFVFLFKRSLRMQHEYFVDREIVRKGVNLEAYLTNLCSMSASVSLPVSNQFSFQSLKTRIIMVTSKPSARSSIFRYFSLLFPVAVMFFFNCCSFDQENFSKPEIKQQQTEIAKANIPSILPLEENKIGYETGFGMRIHPVYKIKRMHVGYDFSAPTGTEIYATASGQITAVQEKYNGYGNMVTIMHGDYVTRYAHMDKIYVKLNEKVIKGEVIGTVGSSGLSTCPHLHYEVLFKGNYLDPAEYLPSRLESVSSATPHQTWD